MRRIHIATAFLLVSVVGLAACGGSAPKSEPTRADYVDAVMAAYSADSVPITRSEARCFVERSIDAVGVSELRAAGVTPDNILSSEAYTRLLDADGARAAERVAGALLAERCFRLADVLVRILRDTLPGKIPDDSLRCVARGLLDSQVARRALVDSISGRSNDGLKQLLDVRYAAVIATCAAAGG
ncbi:MAG: hypothetical protein ACKO2C_08670 [Actinomycetes bacterium]